MPRPTLTLKTPRVKPCKKPRDLTGWLLREYPQVFDRKNPQPLAIGIHLEIVERSPANKHVVRVALGYWCSRFEYRRALARGGVRRTLEFEECGIVTPEEQQHAQSQLGGNHATGGN